MDVGAGERRGKAMELHPAGTCPPAGDELHQEEQQDAGRPRHPALHQVREVGGQRGWAGAGGGRALQSFRRVPQGACWPAVAASPPASARENSAHMKAPCGSAQAHQPCDRWSARMKCTGLPARLPHWEGAVWAPVALPQCAGATSAPPPPPLLTAGPPRCAPAGQAMGAPVDSGRIGPARGRASLALGNPCNRLQPAAFCMLRKGWIPVCCTLQHLAHSSTQEVQIKRSPPASTWQQQQRPGEPEAKLQSLPSNRCTARSQRWGQPSISSRGGRLRPAAWKPDRTPGCVQHHSRLRSGRWGGAVRAP